VEDELVGGEEEAAQSALDALGPRRVVAGGQEGATTPPSALVVHREREILRQTRRRVVPQKGFAKALGFSARDHAATSGGYRHGSGPPEDLELYRGALHARDSQSYTPVMDFVVAEFF
jgi:hypothetical protein